jgi:hypothetical protein
MYRQFSRDPQAIDRGPRPGLAQPTHGEPPAIRATVRGKLRVGQDTGGN